MMREVSVALWVIYYCRLQAQHTRNKLQSIGGSRSLTHEEAKGTWSKINNEKYVIV